MSELECVYAYSIRTSASRPRDMRGILKAGRVCVRIPMYDELRKVKWGKMTGDSAGSCSYHKRCGGRAMNSGEGVVVGLLRAGGDVVVDA